MATTHPTQSAICRDCCTPVDEGAHACPACRSVRVARHPHLLTLSVAHLDCDAFYAAIEKRDDPSIAAKPVIVGGGKRGVVATCCYIARTYGVRSAMPMFKALRACPDAVVIKPRMDVYAAEGRKIRQMMQTLTPLVQPVSIDEAYLDLSGTQALHGAPPAEMLIRLQLKIEDELGLTVSVGLSSNKFLAKTASERDKPRGFSVLSPDEAAAFLAPQSPRYIHGVGPALAAKLARDGFPTIASLQRADQKDLAKRYGEHGLWLYERAWGRDKRPVSPESDRKSVSSETTFGDDVDDLETLTDQLWRLCVRTADRAKQADVEGRVVTLKLKSADFKTITRRTSLSDPTQLAQTLFRSAKPMLEKASGGRRFRLIGVGLSELSPASGMDVEDLVDAQSAKRAAAERAMDAAREKFGRDAVVTGRSARQSAEILLAPEKTG